MNSTDTSKPKRGNTFSTRSPDFFSEFEEEIKVPEKDLDTNQIPYKQRDHAWFIAFGPYKKPRYAMSILVEHGGSGSKAAAPIAKKLFKLVIDRHEMREKLKKNNSVKI